MVAGQSQKVRGARSLGLTGACALVSAAAFFLLWGIIFVNMLSSEVPIDGEAFAGVAGATAILVGLGLSSLASWTLTTYRVAGPGWAVLLPLAASIGWAAAALSAAKNAELLAVLGRLPAPFSLLAASGMTIPVGLGFALAYFILRLRLRQHRSAV